MGETFADISAAAASEREEAAARKRKVAERGRRELRGERKRQKDTSDRSKFHENFMHVLWHDSLDWVLRRHAAGGF